MTERRGVPRSSRVRLSLYTAVLSALCAFGAASPRRAAAEDPRPGVVALQAATCEGPAYQAALMRALEVELTALQLEPRWAARARGPVAARVSVRRDCGAAQSRVEVAIWTPVERLAYERSLGLGDVPARAHARTLALVIAETLSVVMKAPDPNEASKAAAPPPRFAPEASSLFVARPPKATGGAPPAAGRRARASGEEKVMASSASPRSSPSTAPIVHPRRARAGTLSRMPLLARRPPYPLDDVLFTSADPYPAWPGLEIGVGGLARFAPVSTDVLLGMELNASGPLAARAEWALELSYSRIAAFNLELEHGYSVYLVSAAAGVDIVASSLPKLAFGPRFSLGQLSITESSGSSNQRNERTLMTFLGARVELGTPLSERVSMNMTIAADSRVGVLALTTPYEALDRRLGDVFVSWTVGISVQP